MKLTFVGSGDAFGSGGRFNTCFHVAASKQNFLIDCGATSLVALNQSGIDAAGIRTIFISHLHGDHFGGLPFFLLHAHFVARREQPLTIAGPQGMAERLVEAQEVLFAGSSGIDWRFELDVIDLETNARGDVNGVAVTTFEVNHYSGAPSLALRLGCDGRTIAYSGDTQWVDVLPEVADGASLFICECYGRSGPTPYHLDYETLKSKAALFNARRMILTHMNASMLECLDDTEFETAFDGLTVDV